MGKHKKKSKTKRGDISKTVLNKRPAEKGTLKQGNCKRPVTLTKQTRRAPKRFTSKQRKKFGKKGPTFCIKQLTTHPGKKTPTKQTLCNAKRSSWGGHQYLLLTSPTHTKRQNANINVRLNTTKY